MKTSDDFGEWKKCPACLARAEAEKIEAAIPRRFRACRFENFSPKNNKQRQALDAFSANKAGSYMIVGPYGHGKTHLLFAQYRACLTERRCFTRTTHELLLELRDEELDAGRSDLLGAIVSRDRVHLFWDDLDKFKVTDFKLETLFALVDDIYRHKMSLTVTSNLGLGERELQEKLSPAICRRIDDICVKVEV